MLCQGMIPLWGNSKAYFRELIKGTCNIHKELIRLKIIYTGYIWDSSQLVRTLSETLMGRILSHVWNIWNGQLDSSSCDPKLSSAAVHFPIIAILERLNKGAACYQPP